MRARVRLGQAHQAPGVPLQGSNPELVRHRVRLLGHRRVHGGVPAQRVQPTPHRAGVAGSVQQAMHAGVPPRKDLDSQIGVYFFVLNRNQTHE